ncbi:MAG TPA: hypothetical protein VD735_07735 [Candidatus Saccharimonadales bacterium]|nr:hypothetical protein [Candidatus Saccharimonadales bacterium]
MADAVRPTKKQRELLNFIEQFINQHGYSPSYREVMTGLNYTSVATVALHINNLIKRGHLRKRDHSARSLEVVKVRVADASAEGDTAAAPNDDAQWLIRRVDALFTTAESAENVTQEQLDQLFILTGAAQILGLQEASQGFMERLENLKRRR